MKDASKKILSIFLLVCSVAPTMAQEPSLMPSAGPTQFGDESLPPTNCLEWVLGYSEESCSLTCSRVSRVCDAQYWDTIINSVNFDAMVSSAHILNSYQTPGQSATAFCNKGINAISSFSSVPAVFTYELYTPEGNPLQNYCNYPTSLTALNADCDAKYTDTHPAQLFCPCTNGADCNPTMNPTEAPGNPPTLLPTYEPTVAPTGCCVWVLGGTGESCDTACSHSTVQGICAEDVLQASAGLASFEEIVENSYVIPTARYGAFRPNNTVEFCTSGVFTYDTFPVPLDQTPMVVGTIDTNSISIFCYYASSTTSGDCQSTYISPLPGQRFCPCNVQDCTAFANTYHAL
mmetsp:Transcript_30357/g.51339  ORF Transcript_30357/g.51339 Transcript_30357/m.51339 type:complete len:347 (-) Transcript_30357:215-1255(-)